LARNSSQHGIWFQGNSYGTVTDCIISNNWGFGFYIGSYNSNIAAVNNTIYGNGDGFRITNSVECFLRNNIMYDNVDNFKVGGETIEKYRHDINTSNIVDGKPIYYLVGADGYVLEGAVNIGYIAFISSTNVTLRNLDLHGISVMLADTTNSTIENVNFSNNHLYLWGSSYNNITNCVFYNIFATALFLSWSDNNTIAGCDIHHNTQLWCGRTLHLYESENNLIINCDINDNGGENTVAFRYSPHNQVINCNIYNNTGGGFVLSYSS
ncbi:unnamed protein product, partial [marine sediment metagenome]